MKKELMIIAVSFACMHAFCAGNVQSEGYAYMPFGELGVPNVLPNEMRGVFNEVILGRDFEEMTHAMRLEDQEAVDSLLRCGVSINIRDPYNNQTAFYTVITENDPTILSLGFLQFLVRRGVTLGEEVNGWNILHSVAREYPASVVRYLVEAGVPVQVSSHGWTLLHSAALNPDVEVMRYALDLDQVDVNAVTTSGETAMYLAVRGHSLEINAFRMLKDAGARLDIGKSPVESARSKGRVSVLNFLDEAYGVHP